MAQFTITVLGPKRKREGFYGRANRGVKSLTVSAPDRDVAIHRAKQAGFKVVGR